MSTLDPKDFLGVIVAIAVALIAIGVFWALEKRVKNAKIQNMNLNIKIKATVIRQYGKKCVLLEWKDPETGKEVIEYEIWRKTSKFSQKTSIHLQPSRERSYDDRRVTEGTTYFYCIHRPSGVEDNIKHPESQTSEWVQIIV